MFSCFKRNTIQKSGSLMSRLSKLSDFMGPKQFILKPIIDQKYFSSQVNTITTAKYSKYNFIFKFLREEFKKLANCYFLFISTLQFIPGVSTIGTYTTIFPLAVVLTIAAVKELYWDYKRRIQDTIINNKSCLVWRNSCEKKKGVKPKESVSSVRESTNYGGPPAWQRIKWKDINQGDIVKILEDEIFPCDMIFISSSEPEYVCYVETSNLDGETNLKMKQANPKLHSLFGEEPMAHIPDTCTDVEFTVEKSNSKLYSFNGNVGRQGEEEDKLPLSINDLLLRGTVLKNTKEVVGIATYIGHEAKVFMNTSRPPIKMSNVCRRMNQQILLLFGLVVSVAIISTIGTITNNKVFSKHWYLGSQETDFTFMTAFWQVCTFIVLYNTFIPISLLVSLDFNKLVLAGFINNDIEMYDEERDIWACCKTSNLVEELGQVKYIFTDKTGTLTRNIMELKLACIAKRSFNVETDQITTDAHHQFFRAVSLCHTAIAVKNETDDDSYTYKAASPDEEALVSGISRLGYKFTHKSPTEMTIFNKFEGRTQSYEILATLEFSSARQCMSIILREMFGERRIFLYSKGSDAVIMEKVKQSDEIEATNVMLEKFASTGLRTLCFGMKELTPEYFENWHAGFKKAQALLFNRDTEVEKYSRMIEGDLEFIGATAIEDRLQDRVPETIENLRKSGIHIWMLTGDKVETAINIAFSASLLAKNSGIIVIDDELKKVEPRDYSKMLDNIKEKYRTLPGDKLPSIVVSGIVLEMLLTERYVERFLKLALKCNTVVCARVTPAQKAAVTKRVKDFVGPNCVTLAIGDGANDVPMIQSASLGIGISGQEGLQAANNSDYAIPQFKYLEKLLLVHGSWNYHRITLCILYFFYKNSSLHLQQLWFAPFNLYSGTNMFENWHLAFYNACFLLYPPMAIAIFERPYPKQYLLQVPKVYQLGQDGHKYNAKLFMFYIMNSIYHSLFLFFLIQTTLLQETMNDGTTMGIGMVGHIVYVCTMILCTFKCQTEVTGLTKMHVFLTYIGVVLYFIFHTVYSKFVQMGIIFKSSVEMSEMASNLFTNNIFWMCVIVFPCTVAIPDFLWKTWQQAIFHSNQLKETSHLQLKLRESANKLRSSKLKSA